MQNTANEIAYKSEFEILHQFATRLRAARKLKGITQAELGRLLDTSAHMVGLWEKAERMADFGQLHRLCRVLDVSIHYLIE